MLGEALEGGVVADSLLAEAAALRALPTLEAAVREYAAGIVYWRESSKFLSKLSAHEARMKVFGYLLHLSAANRVSGGDGGVAYGQLRELCVERRGEVSERVLKTMLALISFAGFVETWRGASDRRITFYRPTARMLDFARLSYRHAARALDVLLPGADRGRLLAEDAGFLDRLLVSAGRDHAEAPPAERMPDFIAFIGGREGGGAVLAALVLAEIDGEPIPSRASFAARFGFSKTQVSQVIADGVRRGYFQLDATAAPATTALLHETYRRWIPIELAFHARHMRP